MNPHPNPLPESPPRALLVSMAMRWDHAFGLSLHMTDDAIERLRKELPLTGKVLRTQREREVLLTQMSQLYEEVAGHGFYAWDGSRDGHYQI